MDVCCILEVLRIASLCVRERKEIIFTRELVHQLYDHMTMTAQDSIAENLDGKPGIALLITTPSLRVLLDVVGRHSDPRKCAFGTIRWRFGTHENPHDRGGSKWWNNAVHRPVNLREARRDLALLF
jgi:nucleoside diphosphate kinase